MLCRRGRFVPLLLAAPSAFVFFGTAARRRKKDEKREGEKENARERENK